MFPDHYTDHLGSIMLIVDDAGAIQESYRYTEWGEHTILDDSFTRLSAGATSPVGNGWRYTGRGHSRLLEGSGETWYDYRARHYRAGVGRFVQRRRSNDDERRSPYAMESTDDGSGGGSDDEASCKYTASGEETTPLEGCSFTGSTGGTAGEINPTPTEFGSEGCGKGGAEIHLMTGGDCPIAPTQGVGPDGTSAQVLSQPAGSGGFPGGVAPLPPPPPAPLQPQPPWGGTVYVQPNTLTPPSLVRYISDGMAPGECATIEICWESWVVTCIYADYCIS